MKTDISLQVNKSADDVWDYFVDLDKVPEWSSAVLQARPDGAGAPRVGAGVVHRVKMMGRTTEVRYEITGFEPARELAVASTSGPMPTRLRMRLSPRGTGTHVAVHVEARPAGLLRLATPLLEPVWRRAFQNDFATARQNIEAAN